MSEHDRARMPPALNDVTQLFILGDSYSDIGWSYPRDPLPDEETPMGLIEPGQGVTWCVGEYQDNWVVHLSSSRKDNYHDLLIYDVARGGDTVVELQRQVKQLEKLLSSGQEKIDGNVLLVIWIGINDVATSRHLDFSEEMAQLDAYLSRLYDIGFRHLVLIDVPPRRPAESRLHAALAEDIEKWNSLLPARTTQWLTRSGSTARTFSSHRVYKAILDDPQRHGFQVADPALISGGIWADGLHPTSEVHGIMAQELERFLSDVDVNVNGLP